MEKSLKCSIQLTTAEGQVSASMGETSGGQEEQRFRVRKSRVKIMSLPCLECVTGNVPCSHM